MASHTEIERKYDVGPGHTVPALHELTGVARVEQPVEHRLRATYFDTADLALSRARITLRRRTGGPDAGWHLKLPGDGGREEVQAPLDATDADTAPDELLEHVRGVISDHPLAPIAVIDTRRRLQRLLGDGDVVLAEFCDDEVGATRLHPDRAELEWREWEIELVDGAGGLLDEAEQQLLAAGASPAAGPSKLMRVLGGAADSDPAPEAAADATAGEVLHAYVAEMADRLRQHDPLVRENAEDAVHQMRVACRRLRSVLATYRPILRRDQSDPLRDELKWLGGELSLARDSEVIRDRLDALLRTQPSELVLGPVQATLDRVLGGRHAEGLEHARAALDSERYYRLLDDLDGFVEDPPLAQGASAPARDLLPDLLRRDARRTRSRTREVDDAVEAAARDRALHEVRKAAKRLRYAADSAAPALGSRAEQLSDAAEAIQDVLGEHQDTTVSRPLLRTLGAQAHGSGENGFTFGRLHALEEWRATQLREEYAALLTRLPLRKLRRWLRAT